MEKIIYFSEVYFDNKDISITQESFETEKGKSFKIIVEGIYQTAEILNGNGRIYPRHILERETNSCLNIIKTSGALIGELEHPKKRENESQEDYIRRASQPDPERAAGVHISLSFDGKHVYGKSTILSEDGSHGQKLASLLKSGYKIGISSRAVGGKPEIQNGKVIIPDSVRFVTWDFVTNASNPASKQLTTIINESIVLTNYDNELEFWETFEKKNKKTNKNMWHVLKNFI